MAVHVAGVRPRHVAKRSMSCDFGELHTLIEAMPQHGAMAMRLADQCAVQSDVCTKQWLNGRRRTWL